MHVGSKFCIFHDVNYLKGDNYEKNKQQVADEFKKELSKRPKGTPLKFIGYCLPYISLEHEKFSEVLYFNDAIFYEGADFDYATFSKNSGFYSARFSKKAYFGYAKFAGTNFGGSIFSDVADFGGTIFSAVAE